MKKLFNVVKEIDWKEWLLILIGTITWSLTMVKSGLCWDAECASGVGFWGPNGHDGVWHIALAKSLAKGSWEMPVFAGEVIKNYHFGFDVLLSILHKLTRWHLVTLYFQVIPPILALAVGISVYKFVLLWQKNRVKAYWATFFVYFGGSFGWLVSLVRNGRLDGESLFWSQQSISTLLNPPFALSISIIFVALIYLLKGLERGNKKLLTVATFLFGILIQIKVYAGLLCLGSLFISGFWRMLRRKGTLLVKVFAGSLIISILLFSPTSGEISQTIAFKPFWFLETMMSFADRLDWPKFGEAMVNYKLGGLWWKGIVAYNVALIIFLVGNLGTRVMSIFWFISKVRNLESRKNKVNEVDVFIFSIVFAGTIIPLFFVQSGTPWNTIQFFYYSLVFSGILAGIVLGKYLVSRTTTVIQTTVVKFIGVFVILLTLPSTIGTLWHHYLPARPPAKISKEELEALAFLSRQPDGVILTLPFDKEKADAAINNPPRSLYLYESAAYVSAFSGKKVYLEDEVNLEITGYNWRKRRQEIINLLSYNDIEKIKQFGKENNISYFYLVKEQLPEIYSEEDIIFENSEVIIIKI